MKVIEVNNISKVYKLGTITTGTLIKDIASAFSGKSKRDRMFREAEENNRSSKGTSEYVWALKDISFDVNQGDVLGLIGRNGAGKSTLLKILSQVTSPSTGEIKIKGKVASLLEVGTGFHPELSGRDNIYLNGAILGMTKKEITSKLDQIIDFSGVERYVDTPVKRYSSGMYVRLAFAVAAHLDPEILIIDEVLAVGDSEFQKKCLGKMKDVSETGRTVLFVSHNMQAVSSLCTKGIVLSNGQNVFQGTAEKAVDYYINGLNSIEFDESTGIDNETSRRGSGELRFKKIRILDDFGNENYRHEYNHSFTIEADIICKKVPENAYIAFGLKSGLSGNLVSSVRHPVPDSFLKEGAEFKIRLQITDPLVRPGTFPTYFWLGDKEGVKFYDILDDYISPVTVYSNRGMDELGFNPTRFAGYFSMNSTVNYEHN